jgi:hypothetical protein
LVESGFDRVQNKFVGGRHRVLLCSSAVKAVTTGTTGAAPGFPKAALQKVTAQ